MLAERSARFPAFEICRTDFKPSVALSTLAEICALKERFCREAEKSAWVLLNSAFCIVAGREQMPEDTEFCSAEDWVRILNFYGGFRALNSPKQIGDP